VNLRWASLLILMSACANDNASKTLSSSKCIPADRYLNYSIGTHNNSFTISRSELTQNMKGIKTYSDISKDQNTSAYFEALVGGIKTNAESECSQFCSDNKSSEVANKIYSLEFYHRYLYESFQRVMADKLRSNCYSFFYVTPIDDRANNSYTQVTSHLRFSIDGKECLFGDDGKSIDKSLTQNIDFCSLNQKF